MDSNLLHKPKHVAIVMDGNGRWANSRLLPRKVGHVFGVTKIRKIINHAHATGIQCLTVFAFGQDNWKRPTEEVNFLFKLFYSKLKKELSNLHDKNIKFRVLGDISQINHETAKLITEVEHLTKNNTGMHLNVALNYSGTYDIVHAANKIIAKAISSNSATYTTTEAEFGQHLCLYPDPDPDLLIRTSGESRISNFMLWNLAYTELYFIDVMWPKFTPKHFDNAIEWYLTKERRFGMTSSQLQINNN